MFSTPFPRNLNRSRAAILSIVIAIASLLPLFFPAAALAGMPQNPFQLNEIAKLRIESISFFIVVILLLALLVRWIWNGLAKDWKILPRLTYFRSLGLVFIWGLAMAVVLSMITGARELMTPGAWEKVGATYRVVDGAAISPEAQLLDARRAKLQSLGNAIFRYADKHRNLRYYRELYATDPDLFKTLKPGSNYVLMYVDYPWATPPALLAYEPSIYQDHRFALFTDGRVEYLHVQEIGEHIFASRKHYYEKQQAKIESEKAAQALREKWRRESESEKNQENTEESSQNRATSDPDSPTP